MKGENVLDRTERFTYKNGDLSVIKYQCVDCVYNLKKALSCEKYTRIPNGVRSFKIECPYKVAKKS